MYVYTKWMNIIRSFIVIFFIHALGIFNWSFSIFAFKLWIMNSVSIFPAQVSHSLNYKLGKKKASGNEYFLNTHWCPFPSRQLTAMEERMVKNDPYQSPQVRETPWSRQLQCTIQEYCWRAVGGEREDERRHFLPSCVQTSMRLQAAGVGRTRELQVLRLLNH